MYSFQANVTHLYTYEQNSRVAQDEADVAIAPPRLPDTQNWPAHLHLVCQAWQTGGGPLLPWLFGPIGWNEWGEKQQRQ